MTSRERTLLAVVLTLLAGFGITVLAGNFFSRLGTLKDEVIDRDTQLAQRGAEIKREKDYLAKVESLSPRLGKWEKFSLPEGDPKPEAFETHLSLLSLQY